MGIVAGSQNPSRPDPTTTQDPSRPSPHNRRATDPLSSTQSGGAEGMGSAALCVGRVSGAVCGLLRSPKELNL
jgi:hypothetical protein